MPSRSDTITSKAEPPAEVKFGFRPRPLTEQERDLVDTHRGVMVTLVEQDSFAEDLGLQVGDVIDSINRQPGELPGGHQARSSRSSSRAMRWRFTSARV